jgi:hypothetical protein
MADSTVIEEEVIEDEVETPEGEDETVEEAPEEEAESEEQPEEPEGFQKRFTQFKGDTPEEYLKNLEDAYGHSSAEATRLVQSQRETQLKLDQIMSQVANDPQLAEKLQTQATTQAPQTQTPNPQMDPMLAYAKQNVQNQWEKEYHEFVGEHQELQTDQDLNKKVIDTLSVVSTTMQQTQGRLQGMAEGLRMAWQILGHPLNDSEETTRMAVKNAASQSKTAVGRPTPSPSKPKFTQAQLAFARRAYPDKTEDELVELLSQHT